MAVAHLLGVGGEGFVKQGRAAFGQRTASNGVANWLWGKSGESQAVKVGDPGTDSRTGVKSGRRAGRVQEKGRREK